MNPLKRLAGETAIYGISSVVGRLLNYLLFPLHTLVFPTGDYGVITELYVYAGFLNVVYLYGLETAYFRFAKSNEPAAYNTGVTSVLISSLVLSSILVFAATPLVNWMGYAGNERFVYMFSAILGLDAIFAIPFARLRKLGKAKRFAVTKLFGIGVNIFLNLFFLWFCYSIANGKIFPGLEGWISGFYDSSFNLDYVFIANLAGSAAVVLFLFPELRALRIRLEPGLWKQMLKYGYPLLFSGLAIVTNEMLSRAALKYWLPDNFYPGFSNQQILGIFGGVFKLAILINLGIQAFRYAAEPFFFNQSENKDSPRLFASLLNWFVIFSCILWMGISLNLDILQYLLRNPDYRLALDVVPFLMLASVFMGINYNMSAWYKLSDLTIAGTVISVSGALITIVGNFFLIPKYGYMGSAYAGISAYAIMCLISYLWSRKVNPIPYNITHLVVYIFVSALIIFAGLSIDTGSTLIDLILRNGIIIVFLIVTYMFEMRKGRIQEPM